jgi:hypothetical protein
METVVGIIGIVLLFIILWDAFETIVLPRRVRSRVRLARLFYRYTWAIWSAIARRIHTVSRRDNVLSYYGPLSLILLLAVWAVGMVCGFALIHWGFGSTLVGPEGVTNFSGALYMSGSTFFTLGIGDITPRTSLGRFLTVAEAGTGIAFLALVIGYLPVIYQAFSRREVSISLLDARAGSPPTAAELLRRYGEERAAQALALSLDGQPARPRTGHPVSARLGALVVGAARESSLVSSVSLLPLAARQPILADVADGAAG